MPAGVEDETDVVVGRCVDPGLATIAVDGGIAPSQYSVTVSSFACAAAVSFESALARGFVLPTCAYAVHRPSRLAVVLECLMPRAPAVVVLVA